CQLASSSRGRIVQIMSLDQGTSIAQKGTRVASEDKLKQKSEESKKQGFIPFKPNIHGNL
ncbi:1040_t:CDS:2, partial [Diversispora eburnea]